MALKLSTRQHTLKSNRVEVCSIFKLFLSGTLKSLVDCVIRDQILKADFVLCKTSDMNISGNIIHIIQFFITVIGNKSISPSHNSSL